MAKKFSTICLLMYGNYSELHRAAIGGLLRSDLRFANVRIWCNVVCAETIKLLLTARPAGWLIYINAENRPKYKLMRDIFHDSRYPVDTPWVTWLDDDTLLLKPDWATRTRTYLKAYKTIDFCGRETNGRYYPGAYNVVKQAEWYNGVKFGKGTSRHVYGAYWWMKTDVVRDLNWPDLRLSHNGGDWLLSEALRQQSYKQKDYSYGIKVQLAAKRRGLSEVSVGRRNRKHTSLSDGKCVPKINDVAYYSDMLDSVYINAELFDSRTLLVRFPAVVGASESAAEQIRLAKLADKAYPAALPKSLFVSGGGGRSPSKAERKRERRKQREVKHANKIVNIVKQQRRAARERKMAEKVRKSTVKRNVPATTSPLPRVDKTKPTAPTPPPPPKARKTLRRILQERRKK